MVQTSRRGVARLAEGVVRSITGAAELARQTADGLSAPKDQIDGAWRRATPIRHFYDFASIPLVALFTLSNKRIHPAYRMSAARKLWLVWRLYRNTRSVGTGISYRAHVAMASKLLEIPPTTEGVVVECGAFKGGTTTNLSLLCDVVGRTLVVYDSFEGLPVPKPNEVANPGSAGWLRGELDEVRRNVDHYGVLERCEFRKGWFSETLPDHSEPIVMAVLDVDFESSLYDCILNLWPHLVDQGLVFLDEFTSLSYCALFFSERFWFERFDSPPPGLMGAGTGIGLGQFYLGPKPPGSFGFDFAVPFQHPASIAYTCKSFHGHWTYYPKD